VLGIVVGLAAEARIARGLGGVTEAAGIGAGGAEAAAERAVGRGATALLSFGLAGGLAPGLLIVPGMVIDITERRWPADLALARRFGDPAGAILATPEIVSSAAAKRAAWQASGAEAADMESGAVARVAARHGLPFAVLRAICDPAERDLPPASLTALDDRGRIQPMALLRSLARNPAQIGALIRVGRDAALARRALLARVEAAGAIQ
jgi:adenosylhomocysteine nucleosidase